VSRFARLGTVGDDISTHGEAQQMAELTQLDEKLAEVMGLAQAAKETTSKVGKLVGDKDIKDLLRRMREEADETAKRCEAVAGSREGKKSAIKAKARETKGEAQEMRDTYLGDDADGLDGLEFMTMAEAGEVGHVAILGAMGKNAGDRKVRELAEWAQPIEERHFRDIREASLKLADAEDPLEISS
jgi:hypothetical protein